jgi:hypothetical protein
MLLLSPTLHAGEFYKPSQISDIEGKWEGTGIGGIYYQLDVTESEESYLILSSVDNAEVWRIDEMKFSDSEWFLTLTLSRREKDHPRAMTLKGMYVFGSIHLYDIEVTNANKEASVCVLIRADNIPKVQKNANETIERIRRNGR